MWTIKVAYFATTIKVAIEAAFIITSFVIFIAIIRLIIIRCIANHCTTATVKLVVGFVKFQLVVVKVQQQVFKLISAAKIIIIIKAVVTVAVVVEDRKLIVIVKFQVGAIVTL